MLLSRSLASTIKLVLIRTVAVVVVVVNIAILPVAERNKLYCYTLVPEGVSVVMRGPEKIVT